MSTQVCTVNDGLIDPDAFPAKASDLDTGVIRGSAGSIRAMGKAAADGTDHVAATWKGLSGCYHAPEQDAVYALMAPAVTSGHALSTAFGTAADHLVSYAERLEGCRSTLAAVERDARAFRASVINGVQVDASSSTQASFGDYVAGAFDWVPGVDERQVTVPWYEDGASVERNKDLLARYGAVLADISSAATDCANAIQGLVTGVCLAPAVAIPREALTGGAGVQLPWGAPREETRNCPESVGHGAYQFGSGLVQGVGMLVVGYNPANGDFFSGTAYGQAWGGTVDLLGSLVLVTNPVTWVGAVGYATGTSQDPVSRWLYDRVAKVASLSSLVGYDVNATDGWHKWREDGVATGTESVLNIATLFIPGAGEVDAGVEGVSVAARLARITELGANVLVPGGSWVVRGGIRFADTFVDALRVGDRVLPVFEHGSGVGAGTLTLKPASLIDAIDETIAPHTPVSDRVFDPTGSEPPVRVAPSTEPGLVDPHVSDPHVSDPVDPVPAADAPEAADPAPRAPGHDPAADPAASADPAGSSDHPAPGAADPAGSPDHPAPGADHPADPAGSSDHPAPAEGAGSHGASDTSGSGDGGTAAPGSDSAQPSWRDAHPSPTPLHEVQVPAAEAPGPRTPFASRTDLAPDTVYRVEGRGDFYTDSTGRVSYVETAYGKTGHLNPDLMNPQPEVTYVVHPDGGSATYTHVFHTDALGRTDLAYTDHLERGTADRSDSVQRRIGGVGGPGYEGGHLLANVFGGGPEDINLVPMLWDVNRGSGVSIGNIETMLRDIIDKKPGTQVEFWVEPTFGNASKVPTEIELKWSVDGVVDEERFING